MGSGSVAPAPDRKADLADLAVVVIHGIGTQATGSTLLSWAEPIIQHLARSGQAISYGETKLAADPAFITVHMHAVSASAGSVWKFTEARWAEAFSPPDAADVFGWARNFVSRATERFNAQATRPIDAYRALIVRAEGEATTADYARRVRAARLLFVLYSTLWRVIASCGITGIRLGASAACLVLAALNAIPIVRTRLAGLTTAIITSVGDAYLFTSRPVHTAAMMDTIATEITKARGEALKVAVIAHSQGAALAVHTLMTRTPTIEPPDLLITVGAGVNLLSGGPDAVKWWIDDAPSMDWVNIWTAWDPVPCGPISDAEPARSAEALSLTEVAQILAPEGGDGSLLRPAATLPTTGQQSGKPVPLGPEEWPVHNLASIIRDHVTYTDNIPQVIRPITDRLMAVSTGRTPQLPTLDEGHIRRVRTLGVTRIALAVIALCFLPLGVSLAKRDAIPSVADLSIKWVVKKLTSWTGEPLGGRIGDTLSNYLSVAVDASLFSVVIFLTSYLLYRALWSRWNTEAAGLSPTESNLRTVPFLPRTWRDALTLRFKWTATRAERTQLHVSLGYIGLVCGLLYGPITDAFGRSALDDSTGSFGALAFYGTMLGLFVFIHSQVFYWPETGVRMQPLAASGARTVTTAPEQAPLLAWELALRMDREKIKSQGAARPFPIGPFSLVLLTAAYLAFSDAFFFYPDLTIAQTSPEATRISATTALLAVTALLVALPLIWRWALARPRLQSIVALFAAAALPAIAAFVVMNWSTRFICYSLDSAPTLWLGPMLAVPIAIVVLGAARGWWIVRSKRWPIEEVRKVYLERRRCAEELDMMLRRQGFTAQARAVRLSKDYARSRAAALALMQDRRLAARLDCAGRWCGVKQHVALLKRTGLEGDAAYERIIVGLKTIRLNNEDAALSDIAASAPSAALATGPLRLHHGGLRGRHARLTSDASGELGWPTNWPESVVDVVLLDDQVGPFLTIRAAPVENLKSAAYISYAEVELINGDLPRARPVPVEADPWGGFTGHLRGERPLRTRVLINAGLIAASLLIIFGSRLLPDTAIDPLVASAAAEGVLYTVAVGFVAGSLRRRALSVAVAAVSAVFFVAAWLFLPELVLLAPFVSVFAWGLAREWSLDALFWPITAVAFTLIVVLVFPPAEVDSFFVCSFLTVGPLVIGCLVWWVRDAWIAPPVTLQQTPASLPLQ